MSMMFLGVEDDISDIEIDVNVKRCEISWSGNTQEY